MPIAEFAAERAPRIDDTGMFPDEEFRRIAEAGLLAAPLARERGGLGLGIDPGCTLPLLVLLKYLGLGNLSVGRLYEGHANALLLVQLFGTPEQVQTCAADVLHHRRLFAVWNTEAEDGVTITPLDTGRFRLQGAKTFASGAEWIDRPLITGALPDGGWQMCIVPMDEVTVSVDPSWWRPIGMRASASYKVDFSGVEIDADRLIGAPGDYHRQPWFFGGAIRFASVHLGGAEALFNETRRFLRELDRTGDPYQQHRAGRMAILVESGNHWLREAARLVDSIPPAEVEPQSDRIVAHANMTRLAIESICLEVMELTERAVGARGMQQTQPFERIIRDLTIYLRQPAPDAALANVGDFVFRSDLPAGELWDDD